MIISKRLVFAPTFLLSSPAKRGRIKPPQFLASLAKAGVGAMAEGRGKLSGGFSWF